MTPREIFIEAACGASRTDRGLEKGADEFFAALAANGYDVVSTQQGGPLARWAWIMDELDSRLGDTRTRFGAAPPEIAYIERIDAMMLRDPTRLPAADQSPGT